ncbi:MAG TPA: isoprenylcysteine carboxylmethyltransferase family protein [Micropepsaceae bacterium]|nr:isoprenylcysteine carboxylmethyltransferase family protein [Micropepsaceae bacterium]
MNRTGSSVPRAPVVVRIPPPVWAFILLLISYGLTRGFRLPILLHSNAAGFALFVAGFCLAIWGERTFVHAGTELMPSSATNSKLVAHGPFRYTRNPMYSGLLLVMLAVALYFGTWPFYLALVLLFVLIQAAFIPFEEAKMERQFGPAFRDYKSRTPRWGIV